MLADFVLIGIVIGYISRGNFQNLKQANIPYLWLIVLGFLVKFIGPYFSEWSFQWFNKMCIRDRNRKVNYYHSFHRENLEKNSFEH